MTTDRFLRFDEHTWVSLEGHLNQPDPYEMRVDANGNDVWAISADLTPPAPDVDFVLAIGPGTVLPILRDDHYGHVVVMLPEPWSFETRFPTDVDELTLADTAGPIILEAITYERAREVFPGQFEPPTQEDLDELNA